MPCPSMTLQWDTRCRRRSRTSSGSCHPPRRPGPGVAFAELLFTENVGTASRGLRPLARLLVCPVPSIAAPGRKVLRIRSAPSSLRAFVCAQPCYGRLRCSECNVSLPTPQRHQASKLQSMPDRENRALRKATPRTWRQFPKTDSRSATDAARSEGLAPHPTPRI